MPKKRPQSDHNQNRMQDRTRFILDDGESEDAIRAAKQIKELQNMTPEEVVRFIRNFGIVYINEDQPDS